MNREHSLSWAGAEYHPDHTRCKYALPTMDLRCGQALPMTQFRPKQTHSRLIYAVSPLSPTHKTRFGLFPLEQWEWSGEATHKGSSKASLGLCMRWPLNIRGTSFKIFIPSIHPFPLSVVIYSTEDAPNCSDNNAIFLSVLLMICSICFADSAIRSANDAPPSE